MRTDHLEPARSIIERLGGVEVVAAATGRNRTRVYRWMYPIERGGTGGVIPQREIPTLLELARERQVDLSHSDFFQPAGEAA